MKQELFSIWRAAFLLVCCSLLVQLPAGADFKPDLDDDYLKREFDWGLYLDARTVPHYLNYQGSQLHPLERVRVYMREFSRGQNNASNAGAKIYEEFWYHDGHPIGVRRRIPLTINGDHMGEIVMGPVGKQPAVMLAATDALVRVLVDLQLRQVVASSVSTPEDRFDEVESDLSRYGFSPEMDAERGAQMSIHLRTRSGGQDEYLYLHK